MKSALLNRSLIGPAIVESFIKLDPRIQIRNPVMFVTELGAGVTTVYLFFGNLTPFNIQIAVWLWFTVLFANFSEALAEGRGKAQADSLKKSRTHTSARILMNGVESKKNAGELRKGDTVVCEAGDIIPGDGEIIKGIATVDESAITGESAPVVREAGGDRSAVTGGTLVMSDRIVIWITT
ncbi:MAG: potassium-transporting ATPase subunit B, partial [Proteobacteria bacterium]